MKHSLLRGRVQEPELNLVAPLNACPLPPRMQGNHPCTRYSSPHTRRLNRHRGSPVRLLMLQQPWQLRNVGGNASGLVAGEELRRRAATRLILEIDVGERLPISVKDDKAPPIQLGVGPRRRTRGGRKWRGRLGSGAPRALACCAFGFSDGLRPIIDTPNVRQYTHDARWESGTRTGRPEY